MIDIIIGVINEILYSFMLIILLVLSGVYFTFRTRFVQFRLLGQQLRYATEKTGE